MPDKKNVFQYFLKYQAMAERELGTRIQRIRTDNGMEFCSGFFEQHLQSAGIQVERTNVYCPEMNGVAERYNRTALEGVRALLEEGQLPKDFWAEALMTFTYLKNKFLHSKTGEKTPHEIWKGRRPSVRHLKRFGCLAFSYVPRQKRNKLENRAKPGIFVGYALRTLGYRIWFPDTDKIEETKHVSFNEDHLGIERFKTQAKNLDFGLFIPSDDWYDLASDGEQGKENESDDEENAELKVASDSEVLQWQRKTSIRKTGKTQGRVDVYYYPKPGIRLRSKKEVQAYCNREGIQFNENEYDFSTTMKGIETPEMETNPPSTEMSQPSAMFVEVPQTYEEAVSSPYKDEWQQSMDNEIQTLKERRVWELVPRPLNRKIIGCRWVYNLKEDASGKIQRFKARLVAQGFGQVEGLDYTETFSPVINFTLVRLFFILLVIICGWVHKHLDVECAYLYGSLHEDIYMKQPKGYEESHDKDLVVLLKRALYGLHQSGREWYQELDRTFESLGFSKFKYCNCVYRLDYKVIVLVYVDDLALFALNDEALDYASNLLKGVFKIRDLGQIKHFLGVEFETIENKTFLHQRKYITKLINKFNILPAMKVKLPMCVGKIMSRQDCPDSEEDREEMKLYPFREMIGSLSFLASRSRPDIQFAVTTLAQFNNNPGIAHWKAAVQILQYISSTINYGIELSSATVCDFLTYTDSNWAGCVDDRKSTSGFIAFLGGVPFSWKTSKQKCVALSTMEAEYIAMSEAAKEIQWISRIFKECEFVAVKVPRPTLLCDNQSAIAFCKNSIENTRTKHIDIKYHFVRTLYADEVFALKSVTSKDNVSDLFTKALVFDSFSKFVHMLFAMMPINRN